MSTKPRHTTVKTRHGADVRRRQRDDHAKQADAELKSELKSTPDPVLALLNELSAAGHSRTSGCAASGISWHTFRWLCAEYPEVTWRRKGERIPGRAPGNRLARREVS